MHKCNKMKKKLRHHSLNQIDINIKVTEGQANKSLHFGIIYLKNVKSKFQM